jgi:SAM-dependent methyltransferase
MSSREITSEHVAEITVADSTGYWWYAVRQGHVQSLIRRETAKLADWSYLDLGCGAGGVMRRISEGLKPAQVLGLDGTQEAVDVATSRGLEARLADFREPFELPFRPRVVTCLDVLEHLEDPVLALKNLASSVEPGALLVATVPAHPSLWSPWDDACGHHRRYTRRTLAEHLVAAGWRVERMRYFFSFCVPPAWWERRVRKSVQEMAFPPVSSLTNTALTIAGSVERALGSPIPFGTSLVASARVS